MGRRQGRTGRAERGGRRFGAETCALAAAAVVLAACAGRGGGVGGVADGGRPVVERSAAEVFASWTGPGLDPLTAAATDQLNFFDELETRDLAVQDDVLHACLLVGAGVAPTTYGQRIEMARRLGWIDGGAGGWMFDGREATTLADAGRIVLRMLGERGGLSDERVLRRLREQGYIPGGLESYQGLTGTQLISLVSRVHDQAGAAAVVRARRVLEGVSDANGAVGTPAAPEQLSGAPENSPVARREDEVIEPGAAEAPPIVDEPAAVEPRGRGLRFVPGMPLRRTGAQVEGGGAGGAGAVSPPTAGPR